MRFDLAIEFAEIRSLMNLPTLDAEQRDILWETMQRMAQAHPHVYASEWVPYLEAFPHHWTQPIFGTFSTRARHLPQIEARCALIPFGCFNLNISSRAAASDLHALFTSETFASVHTLTLHRTIIPNVLLKKLSTIHHDARLRALHLEHIALRDTGLHAFVSIERAEPFERLVLPGNELTDAGVNVLLEHRDTSLLHTLDLSQNNLPDSSLKPLFSRHFESLCHLDLSGNDFTGDGLHAMASDPGARDALPRLTHLDLSGHALTHDHLHALCDARFAPDLTHLTLHDARLDDRAAHVIMGSGLVARLTSLDIRFNFLSHETCEALREHASHFPQCALHFTTPYQ